MLKLILIFLIHSPFLEAFDEFNITKLMMNHDNIDAHRLNENITFYRLGPKVGYFNEIVSFKTTRDITHSFKCLFRMYKNFTSNWDLITLHNSYLLVRLTVSPASKSLKIYVHTSDKISFTTVEYDIELFDGFWHSIMYSILRYDTIVIWIDCKRFEVSFVTQRFTIGNNCIDYNDLRKRRSKTKFPKSEMLSKVCLHHVQFSLGYSERSYQTVPIDISEINFYPFGGMQVDGACEDLDTLNKYVSNTSTPIRTSILLVWIIAALIVVL